MIDKEILKDDLRKLKREFPEHYWEIVKLADLYLDGKLVEPFEPNANAVDDDGNPIKYQY